MAHWISSKLKAAENILQQIDQQAAESLKKGEKARSDGLDLEISAIPSESKPLKDQLKKKIPESKDFAGKLREDRNLNAVSSENSKNYGVSNYKKEKEVVTPASLSPKPPGTNTSTLTDTDWTELLSVPNKTPTLGTARISNRAGGVRGLKKDSRIQGSLGSGSSLLALGEKKSLKFHNNVPKSSSEPDGQLGNKGNDSARDGRFSDGVNVSSRSSSPELKSDGDSSEKGHSDGRNEASNLLHGNNDEKSTAMDQHVDVIKDGDVGWDKGSPIGMESATINGQLDLKTQTNDNQRFKNGPTVGSQSSLKINSSSPSDGESDSETDSTSSSGSEHEREERRKRRQQILAEKAAAKAIEAIREREDMVAKLEGEKQSLEKILEVRAKQQAQEASELQTKMMETLEAVELEKQKHNSTRMETLTRLAKLETANAELAKSLATAQWNLEVEVNRVTELREQVELKEAAQEELRRKISQTKESGDKLVASKGVEFEREILEAEYSFLTDKVGILQEKAKTLETSIDTTKRELESPTEVEVELKRRLGQLTDHLIQKQAQVESLSSQKATLLFKIEDTGRKQVNAGFSRHS
ncbi:PREDICTED: golgin candidate 2 isoform X2 [Ipomoea nil]|uniref:golgin candidate 2 isoform X2 n=1 Tax=Ipomoea nil TaxID=35883 RepID=UPI0009010D31|nr:PREDICTED: golgin candidate 2 isoform X2 [Ipomoea nil]